MKKADQRKLETVKKKVEKMLNETRIRREVENLEKIRHMYNKRIETAHKSVGKKGEIVSTHTNRVIKRHTVPI